MQLNNCECKILPQSHYNLCATKIGQDQSVINTKVKEVDQDIGRLLTKMTERQKQCAAYAEAFSRVRQISQQLSRCNTLLNQNIELMESMNNKLDVDDRLEPFVWTTN
jgi:BLOC-1 related complex subunit 5